MHPPLTPSGLEGKEKEKDERQMFQCVLFCCFSFESCHQVQAQFHVVCFYAVPGPSHPVGREGSEAREGEGTAHAPV